MMPEGTQPVAGWVSDDGAYEGFIVLIPKESDLTLNPQPAEVSDAGWWAVDDLGDDAIRQKIHDQLGMIAPMLATRVPEEG